MNCWFRKRFERPRSSMLGPVNDYTLRFMPSSPRPQPTDSELDQLGDWASELTSAKPSPDNPTIPAGYTYLLQFISHDISRMDISPLDPTSCVQLRNGRSPRFDLDSVYGGGPLADPQLYGDGRDAYRLKLVRKPNGELDLPRRADPHPRGTSDRERWSPAVVGDARNDENILVSQLHLAIARLHNAFLDRQRGRQSQAAFREAQRLTRWHYQFVVFEDLLPRICPDEVLPDGLRDRLAKGPDRRFSAPPLPLEFSLAAFRVGHSMVRESYRLNDRLLRPGSDTELWDLRIFSAGTPAFSLVGRRVLPDGWTVQWDRFVEHAGSQPQLARQFDTHLAWPLGQIPTSPDIPVRRRNLAYLDLLRGAVFGLADGHDVARALGARLRADDGPLWLYLLREAEASDGSDGKSFGEVAAQLAMQTLYALLWADRQSYVYDRSGFADALRQRRFDFAALLELSGAPMTAADLP